MIRSPYLLGGLSAALLSACVPAAGVVDCNDLDPVLRASSFVLVLEPAAGERVTSPLTVRGCSRTNESNVQWRLEGADGRPLGSGFTTGGGFDGAASFEFDAEFEAAGPAPATLRVFASDESEGEGFPPPSTSIPVVLDPGQA